MTSFMKSSGRRFLARKAAREIKQGIEQAGLDNLKILADNGISIVETYLNGCPSQERARIRRDGNALLQMGVTADMVLDEVAGLMPALPPIMDGKEDYRKTEIARLTEFLKSG